MPTDKEMLDWIDSTVADNQWHDGREERCAVRFYCSSKGGGFRLMEIGSVLPSPSRDVFPTVRESIAAAMEDAREPSDTAETAPSCPVDEGSGEVDGLPDAGPVRAKHGPEKLDADEGDIDIVVG